MTDIVPTEALTELLEAGVHFGHQSKRWNPKMKPFIFEKRNAIHVVDLTKTVEQIEAAQQFLSQIARDKGKVLFVGCKKQAQEAVKEAAIAAGHFYVNQRWLGGTLTNLQTIRRSIQRLKYIEGLDSSPDAKKMGKQEISALKREGAKLTRNLQGIREMERLPDAIIIVDTNADPTVITYPVAGNDDAIRAIRILLQKFVDALVSGGHEASKSERREMEAISA